VQMSAERNNLVLTVSSKYRVVCFKRCVEIVGKNLHYTAYISTCKTQRRRSIFCSCFPRLRWYERFPALLRQPIMAKLPQIIQAPG